MFNNLKAIPTKYDGYYFRSRLEARWAVFFNELGMEYRYEIEGFDLGNGVWYLPDFYLLKWDCFIEIKPFELSGMEKEKGQKLAIQSGKYVYVLAGNIGKPINPIHHPIDRENPYEGFVFSPDGREYDAHFFGGCDYCDYITFCVNGITAPDGHECSGDGSNSWELGIASYGAHKFSILKAYNKAREARFEQVERV